MQRPRLHRCAVSCVWLQERLDLQRAAEAEFARERALVDEVVLRIQQEDALELAARRAKQADTKAYIEGFLREREESKAAQQAAAAAEDRRIQEYWEKVCWLQDELW
jgi:Trichohyalin-plectin-homology domain